MVASAWPSAHVVLFSSCRWCRQLSCMMPVFVACLLTLLLLVVVAESRAALATAVRKGSSAAATSFVRASAGSQSGYSRWFPAAAFLPAAGVLYNSTSLLSVWLLRIYAVSEVKPSNAGIVLGWVTFLALGFGCTVPHMVHPFIVEASQWSGYSLPSINVNPREWIKVIIYRGVNS